MNLLEPLDASNPTVTPTVAIGLEASPVASGELSLRALRERLGIHTALLVSLRAKHAPTAAHCVRVAQSLSAWGIYYRLQEHDLVQIELAGLLHDIGKIGIPERILQKPTALLPEERSLVEIHPQVGIEILRSAGVHPNVLDAIGLLGIWYDGSNRNGNQSPLSLIQRILSIADAFDSMVSEQTYRNAMTKETAVDELRRMSGRQFDPKLTDSFAGLVQRTDRVLQQAVLERWKNLDGGGAMSNLFEFEGTSDYRGSVAIQALNNIFHRKMMDHMNDAVIFVDTELRILEWNQATEKFTGIARSAVLHSEWIPDLIGLCDQRGLPIDFRDCPIRKAMTSGVSSTQRLRLQPKDQSRLKIDVQLMPIFDDRGVLRGGAMLMGDASDQADLEEKVIELHTQATQDPLTKVSNRSELNRRLPEFVAQTQSGKKPGCVLICDIDFFKRINDTFGHSAGDEALKVFASVLKDQCRETDLVARYGGEEFVILCVDCDLASAVHVAENIRAKLRRTPIAVLKGKCLTASFGAAEILAGDSAEAPLDRADQALLQAKQTGRDRVVPFTQDKQLDTENVGKEPSAEKPANSWLSWLSSGNAPPLICADLLSSVPRDLVIEKLKGFVSESQAELIEIQDDRVHLRLDCRTAPMQRRAADRPTVFELKITLQDVESVGNGRGDGFQRQTRMMLEIRSLRNRDRRSDALVDQANRLRISFQSYLMAQEIDETTRGRIIPIYRPGKDGR